MIKYVKIQHTHIVAVVCHINVYLQFGKYRNSKCNYSERPGGPSSVPFSALRNCSGKCYGNCCCFTQLQLHLFPCLYNTFHLILGLWQILHGGAAEAYGLFSAGVILITMLYFMLDNDLGTIQ
jgi:hypothetical protein